MQKNQCHVQTWRDMFAGAGLSCFISLNQLLAFESSTEEDIYFWRRKADGGYSHFKMTANLSLCFYLFKFICIQSVSHMASDFYTYVILVASIESLITGTEHHYILSTVSVNCTIGAIQQILHISTLDISEY